MKDAYSAVVGVDPSLVSTGFAAAIRRDPSENFQVVTLTNFGRKGKLTEDLRTRAARLRTLQVEVACATPPLRDVLVVIEGPSFSSQGGSALDRNGLWWMLVQGLIGQDCDIAVCPPATAKKWATNNGLADKAAMSHAAGKLFPDVAITNSDQADALILMAIGMHKLGWIGGDFSLHRIAGLVKTSWPGAIPANAPAPF